MSINVIKTSPVVNENNKYRLLFDTSDFKNGNEFNLFLHIKNDSEETISINNGTITLNNEFGISVTNIDYKYSFNIKPQEEKILKVPVKLTENLVFGTYKLEATILNPTGGSEFDLSTKINVNENINDANKDFKSLMETIQEKSVELIISSDDKEKIEVTQEETREETTEETREETTEETKEEIKNDQGKEPTKDENITVKGGPVNNDVDNDFGNEEPIFMPPATGGDDMDNGENVIVNQVKNKPKLIISNYKLSPEMAKAGDEFQLDLTFHNTNYEKSVRNIKITLNGQEQSQTATGTQTSGSVFSPVNSSNTFYIPVIYADDTTSKTITLKTVPNAQAQNYTISVQFEYEDIEGNEFTATELIGVPVVQKSEILFGEIKLEEAHVGIPIPIELDFYNTGKDTLSTFMVTIEGEGFDKLSSRYFIGNFQPGASDRFSGEIVALQEGKLSGNIVISYEDSTGQKHENKVPFETEVMAMETGEDIIDHPGMDDPNYQYPNESGFMSYLPYVGVALLLLLLGIVIYRRKKKKNSQKDLMIDED